MCNRDRNTKIMDMVERGMTYGDVAKDLNISRGTVAGVVSRNRKCPPKKSIATKREIAPKDRETRDSLIVKMVNNGFRYKDIQEKLGCTNAVIVNVVYKNKHLIPDHGSRYNPRIRVSCGGNIYESMNKASRNEDIGPATLRHRLKSDNFPDWFYLDDNADND